MSVRISSIKISGYKSFRELPFKPRSMNVMIGPNGAGKSNFISFFRLLNQMTARGEGLEVYVGRMGGANALLHDGAQKSSGIEAGLTFETEKGKYEYEFSLSHAAGDTLSFTKERFRFSESDGHESKWTQLSAGHKNSMLHDAAAEDSSARVLLDLLGKFTVHQFYDTSFRSRIRNKWRVSDNRSLKEDGANLASVLLRLRNEHLGHYNKIVGILGIITAQFADFELEPEYDSILLKWREKGSDMIFNASQASDGTLRTMALVTLLTQPRKDLPRVIIIDEPELGLHPLAVDIVAGLMKSASLHVQLIVATQSHAFIDSFEPEDVVIVERPERATVFKKIESEALTEWLEEYSLSELWDKNVLGGRPA